MSQLYILVNKLRVKDKEMVKTCCKDAGGESPGTRVLHGKERVRLAVKVLPSSLDPSCLNFLSRAATSNPLSACIPESLLFQVSLDFLPTCPGHLAQVTGYQP